MAQTIWICAASCEYGIDVSAHATEHKAAVHLAKYAEQFWTADKGVDRGPFPQTTDPYEVIEAYFADIVDTWEIVELACPTTDPQEG